MRKMANKKEGENETKQMYVKTQQMKMQYTKVSLKTRFNYHINT